MALTAIEIYEQHIRQMPLDERLRLLAMIANDLTETPLDASTSPKPSIMYWYGLGKEIWDGVDAQEYVNKLRKEWDSRP